MASNTARKVFVHYTGTLDDGVVFDSSREREPLGFVVGEGAVIPGFDAAVVDMEIGDSKTVVIEPDQGYGPHDPGEVQTLPLEIFGDHIPPAGQIIMLQTEDGQQIGATVMGVGLNGVEVDFNHPLAGKVLTFEIELIDVQDAAPVEDEEATTD